MSMKREQTATQRQPKDIVHRGSTQQYSTCPACHPMGKGTRRIATRVRRRLCRHVYHCRRATRWCAPLLLPPPAAQGSALLGPLASLLSKRLLTRTTAKCTQTGQQHMSPSYLGCCPSRLHSEVCRTQTSCQRHREACLFRVPQGHGPLVLGLCMSQGGQLWAKVVRVGTPEDRNNVNDNPQRTALWTTPPATRCNNTNNQSPGAAGVTHTSNTVHQIRIGISTERSHHHGIVVRSACPRSTSPISAPPRS